MNEDKLRNLGRDINEDEIRRAFFQFGERGGVKALGSDEFLVVCYQQLEDGGSIGHQIH